MAVEVESDPLCRAQRASLSRRVRADGKHLALGEQTFRIRGVTYGSFLPRLDGEPFPERLQIKRDFADMAALGLNVVRTYAPPPPDMLELAEEYDLRLLVGLHYPDWRMERRAGREARRRVLDAGRRAVEVTMATCAGHASVLAVSVGNEVPSDVVRVHGIGRVEGVLARLVADVHDADADMLVTYSNYPTTEYLDVDGLDLVSFNVFLERRSQLGPYLRHLQIVARDRPLVVSELGLASFVHGADAQACSLVWQLRLVHETGCAGATVFSWTDEWGVGGAPVDGWGFGITGADRTPKPATTVVRQWCGHALADLRERWPRVTVVVCAYNEERVIAECLDSLLACTYPDLEVIVCDDGSVDDTGAIAGRYPFRLLRLEHGGLSRARNAGLEAASGEIVAYLDADASCHPDWPFHLALSLEDEGVVATGGPNLPARQAGLVERAVALAPGGPVEVLVADDRAEHVPGCNMAYEKEALLAVGGFNPAFTAAGDDVDVCWKLLDRGWQIGFSASAQVRHHRRSTLGGYLRQQRGYGRAERLLMTVHPHRFNRLGQARWAGVIYGGARLLPSLLRPVVYHGYQGHAPFQLVVRRPAEAAQVWASALVPLAVPLVLLALIVAPIQPAALAVLVAVGAVVAGYATSVAATVRVDRFEPSPRRVRALAALLHLAQPLYRTWGRLRRRSLPPSEASPAAGWAGCRTEWLRALERSLTARRCRVSMAGPSESWDLEARVGPVLRARLTTAVTWGWVPHHHLSLRPSPLAVVGALAGAAALAASPVAVGSASIAVAAWSVHEAIALRTRVEGALRDTTSGAEQ